MLPSEELTDKMEKFLTVMYSPFETAQRKEHNEQLERLWAEIVAEIQRPEPYSEQNLPRVDDVVETPPLTDDQLAAIVNARVASCLCEMQAMIAANAERESKGLAPVFGEDAFANLPEKHGIDDNSVFTVFRR